MAPRDNVCLVPTRTFDPVSPAGRVLRTLRGAAPHFRRDAAHFAFFPSGYLQHRCLDRTFRVTASPPSPPPGPQEEGAEGPVTPGRWRALHLSIPESVTLPWGVFLLPWPPASFPAVTEVPPSRVAVTRRSHQDPDPAGPAGGQGPGVTREPVPRVRGGGHGRVLCRAPAFLHLRSAVEVPGHFPDEFPARSQRGSCACAPRAGPPLGPRAPPRGGSAARRSRDAGASLRDPSARSLPLGRAPLAGRTALPRPFACQGLLHRLQSGVVTKTSSCTLVCRFLCGHKL